MFSGDIKVFPRITQNMPKEANTDLYRAKYGMPLSKESHERFIATKVPDRKNKDYRARFRNFSFGFPTYKKDNYMRHWHNFVDILRTSDAPVIKYTKIYVTSYLLASFYHSFGGFKGDMTPINELDTHKQITSSNYVKNTQMGQAFRQIFAVTKGPSAYFALFSTAYFWIAGQFQSYDYSLSQSLLRATAIITPIAVFLQHDRPFTNFWYRSTLFFLFIYPLVYTFTCNKSFLMTGRSSPASEKYYVKGVSPQEIAKIEYEDHIQQYGIMFDMDNAFNYYDSYNQKTSDKYIFRSAL